MRTVYHIEIDLDEEDKELKDILREYDPNVKISRTRFKTFEEYEDYHHYNHILGL